MIRKGLSRTSLRYRSPGGVTIAAIVFLPDSRRFFGRVFMTDELGSSRRSAFPFAFNVVRVCQDMPNEHHLIPEENLEDQAIFVATTIDDGKLFNEICTRKFGAQVRELGPFCIPSELEPACRWFLRVFAFVPKFT